MIFLSIITWIWIAACIVAVLHGIVLGLNTWENRRFASRRVREIRPVSQAARVALLAPCKGLDLELQSNLRHLLLQSYDNYEVIFVVENAEDPAVAVINQLIQEESRIAARLVIAGQATTTGQKIHNLIAAVSQISSTVDVLVFVDSDVCPTPEWLGKLIARLYRSDSGTITGYRWFVPSRATLSNCLVYSINSSIAALLGAGRDYIVWGGSWAIRRADFEALHISERWEGTISDDLVATVAIKEACLPIEFEPVCMTASPIDYTASGLVSFLRRQHQIGRIYAPKFWYQSLALLATSCVAVAGASGATCYGLLTGADWSRWPMGFLLTWYALQIYRGWLRVSLARVYLCEWTRPLMWAGWFEVFGAPLTLFYNTAIMCAACVSSRIDWRGITYDLDRDGRLLRILRPAKQPAPEDRKLRFDPPDRGPHSADKSASERAATPRMSDRQFRN